MKMWDKYLVRNKLETKLAINFRKGKEQTAWFYYNNEKINMVTIPKGRGDLSIGTQKSIINQLELSEKNFNRLCKCPLKLNEYIKILKEKGSIK